MSWSFSVTNTTPETFEDQAENTWADAPKQTDASTDEVNGQVNSAIAAALQLLHSGAVGPGPVNVNLVGHANPGHSPRSGWSNDTTTISISDARTAYE